MGLEIQKITLSVVFNESYIYMCVYVLKISIFQFCQMLYLLEFLMKVNLQKLLKINSCLFFMSRLDNLSIVHIILQLSVIADILRYMTTKICIICKGTKKTKNQNAHKIYPIIIFIFYKRIYFLRYKCCISK